MTKVIRPEAARIGSIGSMDLPRSVPLPSFLAGIGGGLLGLLLGWLAGSLLNFLPLTFSVGISAAVCGLGSVILVTYSPWREESLYRAVTVTAGSASGRTRTLCPGAGEIAGIDLDSREPVCPVCGIATGLDDDVLVEDHSWERHVWVGFQLMREPEIGPRMFVDGSKLVADTTR